MAEQPYGVIATFDTAADLARAAGQVRDAGYKNWDCITPFYVHGLDRVMGIKRSIVPRFSLAGGIIGFMGVMALVWWTGAVAYPLIVGGKPYFSPIPAIPPSVELGILCSAIGAVVGMFAVCRLPMHYHPVLKADNIADLTNDKFLIVIESSDPKYNLGLAKSLLEKAGGRDVKELES